MVRALAAVAIFATAVLVPAGRASAKCGPNILGLSVSGPGLSAPIKLTPEEWGLRYETHPAASNALNGIGFGSAEPATRRPAEISDLGPRFLLRYEMVMLDRRGRPSGNEVRIQYLFPYATGAYGAERSLAFTPRQTWETGCGTGPERPAGPWWSPFPPDQIRRLERFGVEPPAIHEPTAGATGRPAWATATVLAVVGLAVVGSFAIRSRGRAGAAPRSPRASPRRG